MPNPWKTFAIPVLSLLLAAPVLADVGLGLEITSDLQLDEPVSIVVAPDGGEALTEGLAFGAHPNDRVDATFTITIRNEAGVPITGYAAEDIWLQTSYYGDLAVDLTDVSLFAGDYLSGQHPGRSDIVWDGVINLSDLIVFANHVNTQCEPWTP